MLESISKNKLKKLRKLSRKKYRYRENQFFIEGTRGIKQVIANGFIDIRALHFDESQALWGDPFWQQQTSQHPSFTINRDTFIDVCDTDHPQGILALCQMPTPMELEQMTQQDDILLATDAIQDPGNMGTIIRTASWFGVDGLLAGKGSVDLFHPKVVRSTAGATGSLPYRNTDLHSTLSLFEANGWETVLLDVSNQSKNIRQVTPASKTIIVVGNEAHGIDPDLINANRHTVHIEANASHPPVESLNAAVALSVALFAWSN